MCKDFLQNGRPGAIVLHLNLTVYFKAVQLEWQRHSKVKISSFYIFEINFVKF